MEPWLPALANELSQGDVINDVLLLRVPRLPETIEVSAQGLKGGTAVVPTSSLRIRATHSQGGKTYALAEGVRRKGLVVSHDCEIDKRGSRGFLLVAPITPLNSVETAKQQELIRNAQYYARVYLPPGPGFDEAYADLRQLVAVDRRVVDSTTRLLSMADWQREVLHSQLLAFFARRDLGTKSEAEDEESAQSA